MKTLKLIAILGPVAAVAACAPQEKLHPSFGNAVQHNMATQIINPSPTYPSAQQVPGLDGPRAAGAQDRYDTGEVIQPEKLRTTDIGKGRSQ